MTGKRGGVRPGAGRPARPDEKYTPISVKLRPDLLAALHRRKTETGQAVNAMINEAIERYLRQS